MNRLAWVTDPHLNFAAVPQWDAFIDEINVSEVDAILLSGDISEAEDVVWQLKRLIAAIHVPIFFVLGNHDFYHGSIENVRGLVRRASDSDPLLNYLTDSPPLALNEDWTVCGDDGWADARLGHYARSPVRMNDFLLIQELASLEGAWRQKFLQREGLKSALRLRRQLEHARCLSRSLLVVTHIPPFREACWYEGRLADEDWAPFFTCHAVGWMLSKFCERYPANDVLVLCGHTHSGGGVRIRQNLMVWTGGAEYGRPRVTSVLDLQTRSYASLDCFGGEQ